MFGAKTNITVTEICEDKGTLEDRIKSGKHDLAIAQAFRVACKKLKIDIPKEFKSGDGSGDGEAKLGEKLRTDLTGGTSQLASVFRVALDAIRVQRKSDTVDTDILEEFLGSIGGTVEETTKTAQMKILATLNTYVAADELVFDHDAMKTEPTFLAKLTSIPATARLSVLQNETPKLIGRWSKETMIQFLDAAIKGGLITALDRKKILK